MTGKTHDLAGFTALLLTIIYLPNMPPMTLATAVTAFGANFVGSLFPDIDQPTSDLWDNFRGGKFFSKIIPKILGGHRHISHSIVGTASIAILLAVLLRLLQPIVLVDMDIIWWSFMIGHVSHIFFDMPTKEGVPLFWPLLWKIGIPPVRFLRIRSGDWIENLVVFPGLLILNAFILYHHYEKVLNVLHSLRR